MADRVNTFGTAVLGLTMECARCHDHKYDPLTQREYYGLAAFFDNIDESGLYSHFSSAVPTPTVDLPTPAQEERLRVLEGQLREAEDALAALPFDEAGFESWRLQLGQEPGRLERAATPGLQGLYPMDDGDRTSIANLVAGGKNGQIKGPTLWREGRSGTGLGLTGDDALEFLGAGVFRRWDPLSLGLWIRPAEHHPRAVVLHRSRAWHDSGSRGYQLLLEDGRPSFSLIHFWPGNALRVRGLEPVEVDAWTHLAITYDGSSTAAGVRLFVNGAEVAVEVVRDALTRTIQGSGEGLMTIGARFRDNGFRGGTVDDLFVAARELAPYEVRALTGDGAAAPTEAELRALFAARPADSERTAFRARIRALRQQLAEEHDRVREVMAMREMVPRRTTRILNRGLYDQPLEAVEPHTPAVLPPLEAGETPHRLALGRAAGSPPDRARRRESNLAAGLRRGDRRDPGELRRPGRGAVEPAAPRSPRNDVRRGRLERASAAPQARAVEHLPPGRAGPGGRRPPSPPVRGGAPRPCAAGQRAAGRARRRSLGEALPARRPLA